MRKLVIRLRISESSKGSCTAGTAGLSRREPRIRDTSGNCCMSVDRIRVVTRRESASDRLCWGKR